MKKCVLISGGTSGIGKEIASIYSKKDYDVFIITSQNKINDSNFQYIHQDLSNFNDMTNIDNFIDNSSYFDRIILCAGKSEWGDFFEIDSNLDHAQFRLNFLSNSYILKKARKHLIKGSKVLFISSTSSFSPLSNQLIYSISKSALNNLFLGLFNYFSKHGISSTLAIPSSTNTPFWEGQRVTNKENFACSKKVAHKIFKDFEGNRKYSTPTTVAKIQLYLSFALPPFIISTLKNMRKLK